MKAKTKNVEKIDFEKSIKECQTMKSAIDLIKFYKDFTTDEKNLIVKELERLAITWGCKIIENESFIKIQKLKLYTLTKIEGIVINYIYLFDDNLYLLIPKTLLDA
jgi:hypothetical protein